MMKRPMEKRKIRKEGWSENVETASNRQGVKEGRKAGKKKKKKGNMKGKKNLL